MKRNWLIIGVVVIVIVVIAVVFGLRQMNANAAATTTARAQTATVTRGNLIATVSAAGNVSAPTSTSLTFQTTGKVKLVNVQVGDTVKKGQLLMQLDTTDLDLALKSAQINLTSAQTNFDSTKASLQFSLQNAQTNLASAQASFDSTKANLQFALQTAQDNVTNSQSAVVVAKAKAAQNPNQLLTAKAALDKATIALQTAQSNYNAIAWRPDVGMTSQAAALQSASIDYNSALASYNVTASSIANDNSVQQAQNQLDQSQVSLAQAQKNLDTSMRTAQAQLDSAKNALDNANRNLDTSTKTAQGQLDSAQNAFDIAKRNQDKASIYAPYDALVSAVNFNPNDSAGTGAAVVILDPTQLQVKLTIAEVDVAKIKAGQSADLTLDALSGQTYSAKVLSVSPVGTVTQGVVNYPVVVSLTNNDGQIKAGMTANLAINVEERDNVLLLPLRAVRTTGNQKTVTVSYKGQNISVPVQTGLTNDTNVEITSGLNEGDVVQLTTTTTRSTGGGGGGFGIPGGGGIP